MPAISHLRGICYIMMNKKKRNRNGKRKVSIMAWMETKLRWSFGILILVLTILGQSVWAAPAVSNPSAVAPVQSRPAVLPAQTPTIGATIQNVRVHSSDDIFRIVMDMSAIPAYTVSASDLP